MTDWTPLHILAEYIIEADLINNDILAWSIDLEN